MELAHDFVHWCALLLTESNLQVLLRDSQVTGTEKKITLKRILKETGSFEHGNEPSGSIKDTNFLMMMMKNHHHHITYHTLVHILYTVMLYPSFCTII